MLVGSVQVMVAEVATAVAPAATPVGAPGVPTVIELDGVEAEPVPALLVAVTVKV